MIRPFFATAPPQHFYICGCIQDFARALPAAAAVAELFFVIRLKPQLHTGFTLPANLIYKAVICAIIGKNARFFCRMTLLTLAQEMQHEQQPHTIRKHPDLWDAKA